MPPKQPPSGARIKESLDRIVETIIYLSTEARRLSRESAAALGLTPTQVTVLKALHTIGDLSLSGLSSELKANNSTVTGIADRMERDGLVVRERSERDRRVWLLRLTRRGRELAPQIRVTPWDVLGNAVGALSPRDRAALLRILKKIADHVRHSVVGDDNAAAAAQRRRDADV